MNRTARLVIGAALIVIGGLALASWLVGEDRESSTQTFTGVSTFVFEAENAPIEITAGVEEVVVEMSVTKGLFGARVDLEERDGTLRLVQDCPFFLFGWGCRASFDVTLPAGIDVSGTTSNGAIAIDGIDGRIDVDSSNGAITITDAASDVTVRTSNGAITASGLASDTFDGRSSNGRVEVAFVEPPTSVAIDTSNGAVELILPSDSPAYAMSTSTSNGTVQADVRTDPSAVGSIEIDTSNGNITVRYG